MIRPVLTIELVPSSNWNNNVRALVTSREWEKCKRITKRAAGAVCEICGGVGKRYPVDCHEVWSYNEDTFVQKLERLIALCPACHEVKHIGRAINIGNGPRALAHLAKVNGWTIQDADLYLEAMLEVWSLRSTFEWTLDLSFLASIGVRVPKAV